MVNDSDGELKKGEINGDEEKFIVERVKGRKL